MPTVQVSRCGRGLVVPNEHPQRRRSIPAWVQRREQELELRPADLAAEGLCSNFMWSRTWLHLSAGSVWLTEGAEQTNEWEEETGGEEERETGSRMEVGTLIYDQKKKKKRGCFLESYTSPFPALIWVAYNPRSPRFEQKKKKKKVWIRTFS